LLAQQFPPNHGLHPTRLSPLEIGGLTRLWLFLMRKLFHETRRAGEANR
jgi:hypothetical protein